MNDTADVLIAYPAVEQAPESFEFHSVGRSIPVTRDAAFGLSDDLVIDNFVLPGIDDSNHAFLGAPPVTPGAIEGNDCIFGHSVLPVLTLSHSSESNWREKVFLSLVNAGSGGEVETTPRKNVFNLLPTGTVDKNRKREATRIGIGAGVKAAKEGPGAR
jgi:hypothetical protein